ncbi:unnamed protein product, partial [Urochloa humidicola]
MSDIDVSSLLQHVNILPSNGLSLLQHGDILHSLSDYNRLGPVNGSAWPLVNKMMLSKELFEATILQPSFWGTHEMSLICFVFNERILICCETSKYLYNVSI